MTSQFFQFVEKHWLLWVAFFVVFGVIVFEEIRKSIKPTMSLLPQAAVNLINHEATLIVDVRDAQAFKNGHIINSINIPKGDWQKNQQRLSQYKGKNVIVVATAEEEEKKMADQLKLQGFNKVYILAAGIGAWQRANFPLIKKD